MHSVLCIVSGVLCMVLVMGRGAQFVGNGVACRVYSTECAEFGVKSTFHSACVIVTIDMESLWCRVLGAHCVVLSM